MSGKEKTLEFLKGYAKTLREFNLPPSDFPLYCKTHMAGGGSVTIHTVDGRMVAGVNARDKEYNPSMPLTPSTMAYARMFVELSNGLAGLEGE